MSHHWDCGRLTHSMTLRKIVGQLASRRTRYPNTASARPRAEAQKMRLPRCCVDAVVPCREPGTQLRGFRREHELCFHPKLPPHFLPKPQSMPRALGSRDEAVGDL